MGESLDGVTTVQQESRQLWRTVFWGTIFCTCLVMVLPSTYAEADDLGIQMILAGEDGFVAAPEVPFLSVTVNYLLLILYQGFPSVPWYGLLLVITQAVGLSLLLHCLLIKLRETPWLGLVFPFFLIFCGYMLLSVTFTQATLTLIFGIAAVIASRHERECWPLTTRRALTCLLLWALLWRWKFGLYCLVFFVPLMIVQLAQLRKYFSPLVLVLCLIAGDRIVHALTSSPQWQEYLEFYDARARLFDMPEGRAGENLAVALEAAGWSDDDFRLIRDTWMLYDEQLVSAEAMGAFMEAVVEHGGASVTEQIEGNLRNNARLLYAFVPIGIALLLLGIKTWAADEHWQRKLLGIMSLLIPVLFLAYFRLVPRVLVPVFIYAFCLVYIWVPAEPRESGYGGWGQKVHLTTIHLIAFIPMVIGLGASFLVLKQQWDDVQQKREGRTESEVFVRELNHPVTLLRTQVGALPGWEGTHPFSRINNSPLLRIIPAGWQVRSPRYYRILKQLGYESGTELVAGFAASADDGEYFVQRFNRTRGGVEFYSQQWLSYLERHHPQRWLDNPELDVVVIGNSKQNPQRLSLLKLLPPIDEESALESLLPE